MPQFHRDPMDRPLIQTWIDSVYPTMTDIRRRSQRSLGAIKAHRIAVDDRPYFTVDCVIRNDA
jgi:hypothetical protein